MAEAEVHQIARVLSDTGIYQPVETMYERLVIVDNWCPGHPKVMGRVWLRVHRLPEASFARGSIWVADNGWFEVATANKTNFWRKAPGFERARSPRTLVETMKLTHEVIAKMQELVKAGNLPV